MRRLAFILVSLLLSLSTVGYSQRQTSGNRGRQPNRTEQSNQRHPSSGNHNNKPQRPSHNNNHNASKPRPGANHGVRPGVNNHNRPSTPHAPAHRPGVRPQRPVAPPPIHHARPGVRPPRPLPFHSRPPRPAHWRPRPGAPSLGAIIGITIGAAFNSAINHLIAQNITYTSSGNDIINVTNVNQYGYMWPQGTLYYNNGYLAGGEFLYYTSFGDNSRYYALSNVFTSQWGTPYDVASSGITLSSTWFTPDNGYVTLTYGYSGPGYATTLTIGR